MTDTTPTDRGTSYTTAHRNVRKAKGEATKYRCVGCGSRARHWTYDHIDPNERFDNSRGCFYSLDPRHYRPRCVSCHKAFDARWQISRYQRSHNMQVRMRENWI